MLASFWSNRRRLQMPHLSACHGAPLHVRGRTLTLDLGSKLLADVMVGFGVAIETICVVFAIVWTRREKQESDERVAEADKTARQAEVRAAEANRETERLKADFSWRFVMPSQFEATVAALGQHRGVVIIEYMQADAETQYFAMQLGGAFEAAGWQVLMRGGRYGGRVWFGILAPPPDADGYPDQTKLASEALTSAGLAVSVAPLPRWASVTFVGDPHIERIPHARICVGPKQPAAYAPQAPEEETPSKMA
jgi:hypothetical protein